MDLGVIVEVFVVTVVGGMGSLPGAFIAAVLIGQLQAFGILAFPQITIVLLFLFMAAVLIVRPWGLLGRPEASAGSRVVEAEAPLRPLPPGPLHQDPEGSGASAQNLRRCSHEAKN